jgi:hypothetical protein
MNNQTDNQIKLYALLVDQLTKYNAIFWQAPALVAANVAVLDRALKPWPLVAVALAIFNGAMIWAFWRMVIRQSEITAATEEAEKVLGADHPKLVPTFGKSGVSSRIMLVATMTVLDVGLLAYALHEAKWPSAGWLLLIFLVALVVVVIVLLRAANNAVRALKRASLSAGS